MVVAVVDSGIMVDHPDLKDHLWTMKGAATLCTGRDAWVWCKTTDLTGPGRPWDDARRVNSRDRERREALEVMAVKFFDVRTPSR